MGFPDAFDFFACREHQFGIVFLESGNDFFCFRYLLLSQIVGIGNRIKSVLGDLILLIQIFSDRLSRFLSGFVGLPGISINAGIEFLQIRLCFLVLFAYG